MWIRTKSNLRAHQINTRLHTRVQETFQVVALFEHVYFEGPGLSSM